MIKTIAIVAAICLQGIVLLLTIKYDGWLLAIITAGLILAGTYGIRLIGLKQKKEGPLVDEIVEGLLKFVWNFAELGIYLWCGFAIIGNIGNYQILSQNAIILIARIISYSMYTVHWNNRANDS